MSHDNERLDNERGDRDAPRDEADLGFDLPPPTKISGPRAAIYVTIAVAVISGAFLLAWLPKKHARQDLQASTKAGSALLPRVEVLTPTVLSSDRSMVLSGSMRPFEEATIRTRSNGYVRKRLVDIGDKVQAGALLVEVDTPELDQQLDQARAQLAQMTAALTHAQATRDYAKSSLQRREKLAPSGVMSAEELDRGRAEASVAEAGVAVAQANLEAEQANLRRLTQEKSFAKVVAPFAGTIISRSVEKGALVNPSVELFKVATTDPMRVMIQVPQDVAPSIHNDVAATVTIREYADRKFEGKVARFAASLDSQSRTMTTVVEVPNPKGELLPGMYARVELSLPVPHRVLEVPSTALINDAQGTRVALVVDDKIHLVPIVIERDTGATIQIATGLAETDRVVKIVSTELVEGRQVEVAQAKPAASN